MKTLARKPGERKRILAPAAPDSIHYQTTLAAVRRLSAGGLTHRAISSAEQFGWTANPYVLALLAQEGEA